MTDATRRVLTRPARLLAAAVLALSLHAPALARQAAAPQPPAVVAAADVGRADWSAGVWDAASRGEMDRTLDLLAQANRLDPALAANVAALKGNIASREEKRAEQAGKIREELDRLLKTDAGDLGISAALRSAVALQMIALDKSAFLKEPTIQSLIAKADAAARAAEDRGDWLMASELYYRLNLLLEEQGMYKADVARERRRLEMIRLYAPERFWQLRNNRRNAEIEFNRTHKKPEAAAKAEGALDDDDRPLPPYNPTGDDFREKLDGIDEALVEPALKHGHERHVERVPMEKILDNAIHAVRTLVTTPDLHDAFPALKNDAAKARFLVFLDGQDQKLAQMQEPAGVGDLQRLVDRMLEENERTLNLPVYAVMHEFGNGGMDALDEFSAIIWPDEMRRFQRTTTGRFFGVGVQIEQDPLQNIRVVSPIEGTPAWKAGIRRGDIIKKVNGNSTVGFTLDQAVDNITGPRGTPVTIAVEREITGDDGQQSRQEFSFELVRDEIPIWSIRGWKRTGPKEDDWDWMVDPVRKIGYVRLSQFAERTDEDLDRAIRAMKERGVQAAILDLRFNPGGLLDKAVEVASRFIQAPAKNAYSSVVVSTHRKDQALVAAERLQSGRASMAGIPVVVLINEGSASASEIVAGAIQDYARSGDSRAMVLGTRSFGKGSVQNVWSNSTRRVQAAVKITTNYYHLPGGRLIHRRPGAETWGVEPNLTIEMLPEQVADALRQRNLADVPRGDGPDPIKPTRPGDKPLDTANPFAGPDLQLQTALVLLQTQLEAAGPALTERPSDGPRTP